jgi:rhamnogalacturonan hydrolase
VALSSLTFHNWTGTVNNGVSRGPIVIRGSDIVPLTDITLSDFSMWTVNQNKILNQCKNVYGTGYCAATSTPGARLTTFTTTVTTASPPAGFTNPTRPIWGVSDYGTAIPIPIYTPAVFWSPVSSGVASPGSASKEKAVKTSSVSVPASTATGASKSSSYTVTKSSTPPYVAAEATAKSTVKVGSSSIPATSKLTSVEVAGSGTSSAPSSRVINSGTILGEYYKCGGQGWTGTGTCESGTTCVAQNEWYSQCLATATTNAEHELDDVPELLM